MVTPEEREEIIAAAVERFALCIPKIADIMLEQMTQRAGTKKLVEQFYANHKEFVPYKQIVASVMEEVDSTTPGKSWSDKVKQAEPLIRRRIKEIESVNHDKGQKPSATQLAYHSEVGSL